MDVQNLLLFVHLATISDHIMGHTERCDTSKGVLTNEKWDSSSDGIQGVRTGSREPLLAMPGYSANAFLLFVIDLLIHAAILSEPVLTFCYSSYNLFETVAYPRRIEN